METTAILTNSAPSRQNVTVWAAQIFLCLTFGVLGVMKLTMSHEALTSSLTWPGALPIELVRLIGIAELAGALGLVLPMLTHILPILTSYAAFGLMALMMCALGYHLMLFQGGMLVPSIVLGALACYVGVRRMP